MANYSDEEQIRIIENTIRSHTAKYGKFNIDTLQAALPFYMPVEDIEMICRNDGLVNLGNDEWGKAPSRAKIQGPVPSFAGTLSGPVQNVYNGMLSPIQGSVSPYTSAGIPSGFPSGFYAAYNQVQGPIATPKKKVVKKKVVEKPKVTLESVVIATEKKEQIRMAIAQIKHTTLIFDTWGFADVFEKGTAISLLFWGIPGTGKTLMAQAIAEELNSDLKIYGTAEIQSSEPGGAERMIKMIFREADKINKDKARRNRVLLFDECDSLLTDRNEVGVILGSQVNTLLGEIEHYEGVVIFTTNRLGKLDAALERRITAKIEFTFPDKKARYQIWKRMLPKKAPLAKDLNLEDLAAFPIAGGNIKNAVLNAARAAAHGGAKELAFTHFKDAIEREMAAVEAFTSEFEKQTHPQLLGYGAGNTLSIGSQVAEKRGDNY